MGLLSVTRFAQSIALIALAVGVSSFEVDESQFQPQDVIERDVAIIGAGAAGTYAAVRLKDQGKSVVVIDKSARFGGHVDTFAASNGVPVDYGVLAYMDLPGTKEIFTRFKIPLEPVTAGSNQNVYVDLTTGKPVPNYPGSILELGAALATYAAVAGKYNDYLIPGFWKLAAGPVPDELAAPFGQLVAKYNLAAAIPLIWTFVQTVGDIVNTPAMFIFREFGATHVQKLLSGGFIAPRSHNNSQLYAEARNFIGNDALLSRHVLAAKRDDTGVKLVVGTKCGGERKLIKARKLIVSVNPTLENMKPLGFADAELALLSKWKHQACHVCLFEGSNLPSNLTVINTTPNKANFNVPDPKTNFIWRYTYTGVPGLYQSHVVGQPGLDPQGAQDLIRAGLRAVGQAGTYAASDALNFRACADHSPSELRVSAEDLKAGFYRDLYALQGKRSTWFNGGAWTSDYSSVIWMFTEQTILPKVLA